MLLKFVTVCRHADLYYLICQSPPSVRKLIESRVKRWPILLEWCRMINGSEKNTYCACSKPWMVCGRTWCWVWVGIIGWRWVTALCCGIVWAASCSCEIWLVALCGAWLPGCRLDTGIWRAAWMSGAAAAADWWVGPTIEGGGWSGSLFCAARARASRDMTVRLVGDIAGLAPGNSGRFRPPGNMQNTCLLDCCFFTFTIFFFLSFQLFIFIFYSEWNKSYKRVNLILLRNVRQTCKCSCNEESTGSVCECKKMDCKWNRKDPSVYRSNLWSSCRKIWLCLMS